MSKISTYEVVPVPKLADKLIGTSVGGEIEDATYNFTLQELLDLFLPEIPANNLQGVLDYGNTATQDINLFGTITTTNLEVTDTANLFITYLNEETHIVGGVYDSEDSIGTSGQVLTSTGEGVAWVTLPPIFTPNLQQVLTVGNTSNVGIVLNATLEALTVDTDDAVINTNITIDGTITDGLAAVGNPGQVLSSTSSGVKWVNLPAYSAVSPLLFNSVTGVFSIQQASNVQGGFLSANDWITFNGKQPAGNYITALTGEATASGPGGANTVLSNSAVINKVLTGFNTLSGTINPSDSILTAFGKTQSQINALVGGVQYKGTWNASTNVPTLQSSVGVQGNYYIVSVAGNTNLNGITDWQVGDWAIFSESTWQKVDNTDAVTSVNGFTGAVSLITDDIPEGSTNLYYLNSRARGALSFAAGSGAYNNVTGVITIPTNNNQILNGAGYITLASLSASAPLTYNNLTGGFAIQKADATNDGYLSSTDWSTFNNKQNYLGGTGLVKSTAGTISYITDNSGNWNTAYDRSIVSAAVTGTSTKTLTLTEQDGNTIQASWTDLDTGLTSVGVSMPSAFTVTNSPLTANGTIGITGAGTSLQYIDGTGALQNFPGLTGFVPYTGANQNVNLGEYGISAGYFQADLTPTNALQVGRMQWNATDGTMDLRLLGNNVTLQIGEENVTRVVNKSGIDLLEENYQVVRLRKVAEGGAQGQRIAVVLAQGNSENNSTEVLGLVTETILANQEGFITCFGEVKDINTTGSLQGETWTDGDILYLSNTVAGGLTNVRPVAPNHSVTVGYVSYAHAVHGKIYMAIDTGYELGELHNVYAPSPTNNQSIYWNATNSRYELNTIEGILGYTPANAATTLTINGTTYDLSANRTWSVGTVTSVAALTIGTAGTDLSSTVANGSTTPVITLNVPTASAANRGALSAADWSTFNTKVGSVTASSPLASSGGQTPNITIQQASGSQNGFLSSTDWTTFNNKQAAGNYITSLTGEATASGPGAASVTLSNSAVTGKVLTGINITGGTVLATDSILTGFGKLQNQINGLIGSTIYQGTWNANTNTPTLTSSVGTRGYYYIVNVAGNTNLNGITDWQVGDWAIYDGTAWQKVDNTDAVSSVNGQTGAVSLTTDNIPEGTTNLYFTNARSRAALSFAAGSGAYNSTTGVITIPTNTNQLTNGASFITLTSLSASAPIQYNNTTGVISITQAGASSNGFLSSTDWNTFNNKQVAGNYVTTDTTQTITALKTFTAKVTINTGGTDDQLQLVGVAPSVRLSNAVSGATINGFIAMAGAANNYIQGAVAGDMCIGNQNNGKIIYGFGSGTATAKMSLDSSGNVVFAGNITLSTSLSNGTYTYTLPGATGTLALTSQIPSLSGYVQGSGTANYLPKFTAASTIGNSTLREINGNLGLGIDPSAWVGFNAINIFDKSVSASSTGGIVIARNWYFNGAERYVANGTAQRLELVNNGYFFQTAISNTSGPDAVLTWTTPMSLLSTGNLLLGTTSDTGYRINVNGTSLFSGIATFNGTTVAANGSINIESTDPAIRFRYTGGTANARIYEWRAVAGGGVNDRMELRLWNDAQTSVTVLAYVNPSGYLTANKGFFSSNGASDSTTALLANASTNDNTTYAAVFGSLNAGYRVVVRADGRLGIGNVNPVELLDVTKNGNQTDLNWGSIMVRNTANYAVGNDASIGFALNNAGNTNCDPRASIGAKTESDLGASLVFNTRFDAATWAERMRIFAGGNVGIGTGATNAGYKLDVNGTGRFSGSLSSKDITIEESGSGQLTIKRQTNGYGAVINFNTTSTNLWFMGMRGLSNNNFYIYNQTAAVNNLILDASSGAATFSNSVGTGGFGAQYSNLESSSATFGSTIGLMSLAIKDGTYNPRSIISYKTQTGSAYSVRFSSTYSSGWGATNWVYENGFVGIGTDPSYKLDVYSGASGIVLNLQGVDAYSAETGILMASGRAKISAFLESSGGTPGSILRFYTMPSGGSITQRGQFKSNGDFEVGFVNSVNDAMIFNWAGASAHGSIQTYSSSNLALQPYGNNLLVGTLSNNGARFQVAGTSTFSGQLIQGGGAGRATNGTTVALTYNTAFSSNSDTGDQGRFLSIVNESTVTNAYSAVSFRVNPSSSGGGSNAMLDMKFVNANSGAASTLYWTFLTGSGWFDRMTLANSGTLTCAGDVIAYGSPSDARLKTIKEKVPNALESILKLNGYRFDWKEVNSLRNYKEDIGVIAQEVASVLPELARTNEDGYMSVRHQGLTAVLIEAIKEQQKQIDELKKQLA